MAKSRKRVKWLRVERQIFIFCFVMLLMFPVMNVFSKATLSKTNLEVERLKREIRVQQNRNQGLAMKINELKSFENIQLAVEREGLAYNSANIKVIARD
jgi:cell division protein FtsL